MTTKTGRRFGSFPDHDPGIRHPTGGGQGLQLHDPERGNDRSGGDHRDDAGAGGDALSAVGNRRRHLRDHPGAGGGEKFLPLFSVRIVAACHLLPAI